jgi:hypothetical protein
MTDPTRSFASVLTQRRMGARLLPRWLLVAGAVALVGVSIDLFRGRPASALTAPAAPVSSLAVPLLDHSVVTKLVGEQTLEPGASIAAYDVLASATVTPVPEAPAQPPMVDDALEPGASVAAYER